MKIPRIKLPDKNLISLREFISGWRVNYHSPGLGWFKLNLGKTTTFPRSTLPNPLTLKNSFKERFVRLFKLLSVRLRLVRVMFTGGDTEIWLLFSLATLEPGYWWQTSSQQTAQTGQPLSKPGDANLPFLLRLTSDSIRDKQAGRWQLMSQLSPKISGEYIMDTKIFPCHYLGNILSKKHQKMCPGHVTHSLLAQQTVLRLINGITRPLLNRSLSLNQNHWILWSGACPGAGCWVMGQRGANQVSIDTNSPWSGRGSGHPVTSGHHIPPSESLYPGLFNYLTQTNKIPCLLCSSLPSSEIHKKLAVFPKIGIR